MGSKVWDYFHGTDYEITRLSPPHLTNPRRRFVVHRDLCVSPTTARVIALALTDEATFQGLVPTILRDMKAKDVGETNGLAFVASQIAGGLLAGNTAWRFGVTPIPSLDVAGQYFFEIRIILGSGIFAQPKLGAKLFGALLQSKGELEPPFKTAMRKLIKSLRAPKNLDSHPGVGTLLQKVFLAK